MKKFECTSCTHRKCISILEDTLCSPPQNCVNEYVPFIPNWHEVKEAGTDCNQLPDWCKVGEWVYNIEKKQYQTICLINGTVICNNINEDGCTQYGYGAFISECVQARKRPFNAEEMKALVGKILVNKKTKDVNLVTDYINEVDEDDADYHYCTVYVGGENLVAEDLLEYYTINGNPCYVLEHLENGGWVE